MTRHQRSSGAKGSTVGFKTASADLHRASPWILFGCIIVVFATTMWVVRVPLPEQERTPPPEKEEPVVIQLQTIPRTRHRVTAPAPPRPFITPGLPIEVNDDIVPDDITIEDTVIDVDAAPAPAPPPIVADTGAQEEEDAVFEYFAVEEQPRRIENIVPDYPEIARRARIEGTVVLRVLVNTQGAVDSVLVEEGPEVFRQSAIDAARKTRFTPAKQNDRPVACWVIMPYRFTSGGR